MDKCSHECQGMPLSIDLYTSKGLRIRRAKETGWHLRQPLCVSNRYPGEVVKYELDEYGKQDEDVEVFQRLSHDVRTMRVPVGPPSRSLHSRLRPS